METPLGVLPMMLPMHAHLTIQNARRMNIQHNMAMDICALLQLITENMLITSFASRLKVLNIISYFYDFYKYKMPNFLLFCLIICIFFFCIVGRKLKRDHPEKCVKEGEGWDNPCSSENPCCTGLKCLPAIGWGVPPRCVKDEAGNSQ